MGNATTTGNGMKSRHRFSLRRFRSSDSITSKTIRSRSSSRLNGKMKSIFTSQEELDGDVKMVHKMYKDQHSKKALESELQAARQQLTDVLDQLDRAKAEIGTTMKELEELRSELDNVKRDLNREVLMFSTGFKQLSSAVERLAGVPKNNKMAKRSEKWRIRLDCQCIDIAPLPAAPITVRMANFSVLRKNYEWFNLFFFSHDNGYKLCLRVFPSGYEDARETSMSVFVQNMNGPHDNNLLLPMKGLVVVELLNQIKDKHHYHRTISYDDNVDEMCAGQVTSHGANGMGEPYFISYDDLFKTTAKKQFLRDDCVYFRISYRI